MLLLQALFKELALENLSDSDDTRVMKKGLTASGGTVDIHHAGTAMRFLTAYFSTREGMVTELTGSQRMTERPISILVDALRTLGAEITYSGEEGYPPLRITGKKITAQKVSLASDVSSQYISALILIAPALENGLEIHLKGKTTSVPYIKMTLALLDRIGIGNSFEDGIIKVSPATAVGQHTLTVESDWSSASYFYSLAAISGDAALELQSYRADSLQGDSVLQQLYTRLGVTSSLEDPVLQLKSVGAGSEKEGFTADLANAPDIAQTIAVTCFAMGIGCHLTGLHTLKIKETDRLEALKTELSKFGARISVTDSTLTLEPSDGIVPEVEVATYNDHRMAMAFAPLALKVPVIIKDAGVVSKSFPGYWDDLRTLGFSVEEL